MRAASAEPPVNVESTEENINFKNIVDKVIKYKKLLLEAEDLEGANLHEVFMMPDQIDLQAKCRHLEEKLKKLNKETQRVPRKV